MNIHYIPVGIEANSKEEAEQKILKLQQIAASHRENKQISLGAIKIASGVLKLLVSVGNAWLDHRQARQKISTSDVPATFREFQMLRRSKEKMAKTQPDSE